MATADLPTIEVSDLRRVYFDKKILGRGRETVALDGISFAVARGSVFGLLGPNGAGKTTTVRILTTLLTPTSGQARVLGLDVAQQARAIRPRIAFIFGGDRGLYGRLTGKENLRYFAALHQLNPREAKRRAELLLEQVGLDGRGDTLVEQYSRGMKQRLHLARGLLIDPDVLFLDEPTIGLDPVGARDLRRLVPDLAAQGKTVLLTTHYMFEADAICDRLAIINKGRLIAEGTPAEIKGSFGAGSVLDVVLRQPASELVAALEKIPGTEYVDVSAEGPYPKLTILAADAKLIQAQVESLVGTANLERISLREPTLEEAYLKLVR
ncbi:MAG: type transport system ATP-binding protein [Chloroflexota bacterium]|jgi:ABC-2 type transport system ATP-binding protein|nr:type transport system ATP-binding protein [Chloroflexota bacterium]